MIAFALEFVQAALTPVRMAKGLRTATRWLLDPLRTVKNLAQDALMTTAGLSTAPRPGLERAQPRGAHRLHVLQQPSHLPWGPIIGMTKANGHRRRSELAYNLRQLGMPVATTGYEHEFSIISSGRDHFGNILRGL